MKDRWSKGKISYIALAILFISAGILHFTNSALFVKIVPTWLSDPLELVYISGVFEILGGLGLLMAKTRRLAGIGLIALLLAVFPANINMALNGQQFANIPVILLWLRLPLQFVLIGWVWWTALRS
jgi:uncharacterized membrane protein